MEKDEYILNYTGGPYLDMIKSSNSKNEWLSSILFISDQKSNYKRSDPSQHGKISYRSQSSGLYGKSSYISSEPSQHGKINYRSQSSGLYGKSSYISSEPSQHGKTSYRSPELSRYGKSCIDVVNQKKQQWYHSIIGCFTSSYRN